MAEARPGGGGGVHRPWGSSVPLPAGLALARACLCPAQSPAGPWSLLGRPCLDLPCLWQHVGHWGLKGWRPGAAPRHHRDSPRMPQPVGGRSRTPLARWGFVWSPTDMVGTGTARQQAPPAGMRLGAPRSRGTAVAVGQGMTGRQGWIQLLPLTSSGHRLRRPPWCMDAASPAAKQGVKRAFSTSSCCAPSLAESLGLDLGAA